MTNDWLKNLLNMKGWENSLGAIDSILRQLDDQPYFFPEDSDDLINKNLAELAEAAEKWFQSTIQTEYSPDSICDANHSALSIKLKIDQLNELKRASGKKEGGLYVKRPKIDKNGRVIKDQIMGYPEIELVEYSRKNKDKIGKFKQPTELLWRENGSQSNIFLDDIKVGDFKHDLETFASHFNGLPGKDKGDDDGGIPARS